MRTKQDKIVALKERINKLEDRKINIKCPGVMRKLRRELRNLEK